MKLTKNEYKAHSEAEALLALNLPPEKQCQLSLDEREFILDNWHPGAHHVNSVTGAYFTPRLLARDLSIYIPDNSRVIDLCAGIGHLAYYAFLRLQHSDYYRQHGSLLPEQLVCVEINPDYLAVGQRILPKATWILADVFDLPDSVLYRSGRPVGEAFDFVISNPPFGRSKALYESKSLPLQGSPVELNVLFAASKISRCGAFILPQESCPFRYSGQPHHEHRTTPVWSQFYQQTQIVLESSSIDCSIYRDEWRDVSPNVEIALWDLDEQAENWPLSTSTTQERVIAAQTPQVELDLFT